MLRVTRLDRAPDYVMFAHPVEAWVNRRVTTLWMIEDGKLLRFAPYAHAPQLYLMEKSALAAWRNAHPLGATATFDEAAAELVRSEAVVRCTPDIPNSLDPPDRLDLELLEGGATSCVLRDARKADPAPAGDTASKTEECDRKDMLVTSITAGVLGLLGALLLWERRRRATA